MKQELLTLLRPRFDVKETDNDDDTVSSVKARDEETFTHGYAHASSSASQLMMLLPLLPTTKCVLRKVLLVSLINKNLKQYGDKKVICYHLFIWFKSYLPWIVTILPAML